MINSNEYPIDENQVLLNQVLGEDQGEINYKAKSDEMPPSKKVIYY